MALYYEEETLVVTDEAPTKDNLKPCTKPLRKSLMTFENFFQYLVSAIHDLR
jgi:hypothetical protein